MHTLQRTGKIITEIYDRNVDTVYRICFSFMKNTADTEDMVQETFLRLLCSGKKFHSVNHEKAWLIVTASNLCKDALKHWWHSNENIEDYEAVLVQQPFQINNTLEAILELPEDFKAVVYMYYYEGYSTREIASFMRCPPATVRSRLSRARQMLKSKLGGDFR